MASGVFSQAFQEQNISYIVPSSEIQKHVMQIIYAIKAGMGFRGGSPRIKKELREIIHTLQDQGARSILLGCTELSLYFGSVEQTDIPCVDPMRILAQVLAVVPGYEFPNLYKSV